MDDLERRLSSTELSVNGDTIIDGICYQEEADLTVFDQATVSSSDRKSQAVSSMPLLICVYERMQYDSIFFTLCSTGENNLMYDSIILESNSTLLTASSSKPNLLDGAPNVGRYNIICIFL